MKKLTVIDFFCGAGGFSEGFRQQGFEIIHGVDYWKPAIDTFNFNFGLNCKTRDMLEFEHSIDAMEALPDTDIILGSPPCVTFSSSNISGKADKTSGIKLTLIFLRIVALKKWQSKSKLKAWFMENVPNSINHLGAEYTFEELGLGEWATKQKIGRSKIAITLRENQKIVNSADYGSPQSRERVISGEIINRRKLIIPDSSHSESVPINTLKKTWLPLAHILDALPKPNAAKSSRLIFDPNYSNLSIPLVNLTDHFYDTGLYECEWRQTKFLKINHPYMGRMAFPERRDKPSRTITATKIRTSREAIVYPSEWIRHGNGEFRTPTVREAASIMSFPITFQFLGSEGLKWRLVGNAVCPSVARALASQVLQEYGLGPQKNPIVMLQIRNFVGTNLNTFHAEKFSTPPRRTVGSRFRRHPFKDGNITVTLSNYNINTNEKKSGRWRTSIQYGNGEGFPTHNISDGFFQNLEPIIRKIENGKQFLAHINNGFSERIASQQKLQEMYEEQTSRNKFSEPTILVEELGQYINSLGIDSLHLSQKGKRAFRYKKIVPAKQLLALYAINKIASIANGQDNG